MRIILNSGGLHAAATELNKHSAIAKAHKDKLKIVVCLRKLLKFVWRKKIDWL
jgi:hypothetical protein